jgi:hypothetical protein
MFLALIIVPVLAELSTRNESIMNETHYITLDPIGDKRAGDPFTITAVTNLEEGSDVLVQVYGSHHHTRGKNSIGGATGVVEVVKGEGGVNRTEFNLTTKSFWPEEYLVIETAVNQTTRGYTLFNVFNSKSSIEGTETNLAQEIPGTIPDRPIENRGTISATKIPGISPHSPVENISTVLATQIPVTTPAKSSGLGFLVTTLGLSAVVLIIAGRN